jgi:ribonuclease HI
VAYTVKSVIRHQRSAWAFTARSSGRIIQEASDAFARTRSSVTMEIVAVTKVSIWLDSHDYTHVFILSDSLSMIRKIEKGTVCCQWVESLWRSSIRMVTFIFVPGHAGIQGNKRADRLEDCAVIRDRQPMDCANIVKGLMEIGRKEDFENRELRSLHRYEIDGD